MEEAEEGSSTVSSEVPPNASLARAKYRTRQWIAAADIQRVKQVMFSDYERGRLGGCQVV